MAGDTELAGVDMRLEPGAIRCVTILRRSTEVFVNPQSLRVNSELHWHTAGEWAYILKGVAQISTVTPEGQNYVGTVVSQLLCFSLSHRWEGSPS